MRTQYFYFLFFFTSVRTDVASAQTEHVCADGFYFLADEGMRPRHRFTKRPIYLFIF
jgi:hypothetical protein